MKREIRNIENMGYKVIFTNDIEYDGKPVKGLTDALDGIVYIDRNLTEEELLPVVYHEGAHVMELKTKGYTTEESAQFYERMKMMRDYFSDDWGFDSGYRMSRRGVFPYSAESGETAKQPTTYTERSISEYDEITHIPMPPFNMIDEYVKVVSDLLGVTTLKEEILTPCARAYDTWYKYIGTQRKTAVEAQQQKTPATTP